MPRVLIVCPRHPAPPTRGDQLRVNHLAVALARRADVALLCFGDGDEPALPGVEVETVARGPLSTLTANLALPNPSVPAQARIFADRHMTRALRRQIATWRPDVVQIVLARMGPYLDAVPDGIHVHVDFIDALSLNMSSRAASSPLPLRAALNIEAAAMRSYETRLARAADSCSVVAERDREASEGLRSAAVIPNGVDTAGFAFRDPADRPERLIFFGNLGYFHNVAPARAAALEILPAVRRELPSARLLIAGARPAREVAALASAEGVELRANVPNMADELHDAALAVLPMVSGSGMKNKVLEAFAAGTPVVTNRAGIDGVDGATEGVHYLGGETPADLAAACARLLSDPAERSRLAAAGAELVRDTYSWDGAATRLLELYAGGNA